MGMVLIALLVVGVPVTVVVIYCYDQTDLYKSHQERCYGENGK